MNRVDVADGRTGNMHFIAQQCAVGWVGGQENELLCRHVVLQQREEESAKQGC